MWVVLFLSTHQALHFDTLFYIWILIQLKILIKIYIYLSDYFKATKYILRLQRIFYSSKDYFKAKQKSTLVIPFHPFPFTTLSSLKVATTLASVTMGYFCLLLNMK